MKRKKYTHIFFDLDNTLWDFRANSYHALQATFFYFSINLQGIVYDNFFNVYSKHNKKLWEDYRKQIVTKNELKKLRFQKTFDELNIKNVTPDEINSYYLHEMPKQNKLIDGAEEILAYLKSKGYLLFIVTNGFKEVQFKKLETAKLTNYFDKVFISEEVKAPKPDPKIFEHAIKSANAPKQKSLMIGDDFEIDVKGALNYGIDAVFLTPDPSIDHQNIDFVEQVKQKCYFINELKNLKEII